MTSNYFDYGKRPATDTEIENMKRLNAILDSMDDAHCEAVSASVWDYLTTWGIEHKKAYNRLYRFARVHGFTVEELATAYCID